MSELADSLKIAKASANRIVKKLSKEGFLDVKVLGRVWRITCNKDHIYNYTKKIAYNLMLIYSADIIERVYKIVKNPKAVVLFGSYRKGDDTEKSDLDIAVEIIDNKDVQIVELEPIPQLGYRKNIPVNLYIFSRKKIDLNLFANIANGIVLEGFLEVRP
ncbi:nucleotidyltransferase domain-containing protein [Candidatus Woesearchaeota archaeon]|nr:nucleotidyltransferase domain-containing protein [Candidatus Woesearchaeota archaeon]